MIFPFILKIFFHIQHCIYMVQYYLHKINKWHCVVRSSFLFFLFPTALIFKQNKNDKLKKKKEQLILTMLYVSNFIFYFFFIFQQHYLPPSLLQSAVLSLPYQSCFHLYKNTTNPSPPHIWSPSKLPLISTLNAQTVSIMCQQQIALNTDSSLLDILCRWKLWQPCF